MTLSRRAVLQAAGLAFLPGPACDGETRGQACSIVLEVSETAALIVVWSDDAAWVHVTVGRESDGAAVGHWKEPVRESGIAVIDARDLAPGTRYVAAIAADERVLDPHRFVTAPAVTDERAVRLAWSADIDPDPLYDSPMFETLAAAEAEVFVSLGDWPYADNPPAAQTVDEFRAAHLAARSAAKLQAWLHGTSVRGILDDHEIRNDWDARFAESEPERSAAALQVWDEWFPRRGGPGPRYRSWRWGAHLECFLLDCRSFRSASTDPDVASKTMLGPTQRQWLVDGVIASPARFKLIFTSVPLDHGHGVDHWAGYTVERAAILDALAEARTPGVIFLSADQHWFAAQTHAHGAREFQTGPLARAPLPLPDPHPNVMMRSGEYNAGVIDADAEGLRIRVLGAAGAVLWDERFTPEQLTLRRQP